MTSLKAGLATAWSVGLVVSLGSTAAAQSFNLDSSTSVNTADGFGSPSSSFAGAASQPGTWNAIVGIVDTSLPLLNLDGSASGVTFTRSTAAGGNFSIGHPNTTRDFQLLLDDGHDLGASTGFVSYTFSGLQNGTYEVYTYAIAPDLPEVDITIVRVGTDASTAQNCGGGPMPVNAFVLGLTHVIHTVEVTTGTLQMQADGAPGSFGTINGFQIKLLPPSQPCPADITGTTGPDGVVDVSDLLAVIGQWGSCPAPPAPCPADIAGGPSGGPDGVVNVSDLLAVIGSWGPCP